MPRPKLIHPCEWCGTHVRQPGCYDGCNPAKNKHGEAPAERCSRGRSCARERDAHEVDMARVVDTGWVRSPDKKAPKPSTAPTDEPRTGRRGK